jgi:hypothetical protein
VEILRIGGGTSLGLPAKVYNRSRSTLKEIRIGVIMAEISTYVFNQTDLRGNFSFTNMAQLFTTFGETAQNTSSGSTLTVSRESREVLIDLYDTFNRSDFLFLIDIAPVINGVTVNPNPGALMVLISSSMSHFGYRTSDIRAGWDQWRHVPYHDKDPNRHQDSDLLNQIAFTFHIDRGFGTVDNDGWIAFYFMFFLDGEGKLGAFIDGGGAQFGGGEGLPDGGPDLGTVLNRVLPSFVATLQSFLDSFCSTAAILSSGVHDPSGRTLFDQFYLLPGDGTATVGPGHDASGFPNLFSGTSHRPVDAEVSLALLPKQKMPPSTRSSIPSKVITGLTRALKDNGWSVKVSEATGIVDLKGSQVIDGRNIAIDAHLTETFKRVSNTFVVKRDTLPKVKAARKKTKKS